MREGNRVRSIRTDAAPTPRRSISCAPALRPSYDLVFPMNAFQIVFAYLRRRPLGTLLNVALLGVGVASIVVLLLVGRQVERGLVRDAEGVDLVVGAKGSPLQLILSAVYHLDSPTGNIPVAEADRLAQHPMVAESVPVSLGDSFRGYRIVGTTAAYASRYAPEMQAGEGWREQELAEGAVVLGARVAGETGLGVGDEVVSAHGLAEGGAAHGDHPMTVAGIYAPTGTVLDRLILTSLETVWETHGAHEMAALTPAPSPFAPQMAGAAPAQPRIFGPPRPPAREYTALLIRYASPMAAVTMPRMINSQTNLQAASPAFETQRLLGLLGVGFDALRWFGVVLVAAAALGVGIALANALRERRYDLAVMRSLGAGRAKVFGLVLLEGVLLAVAGTLLGLFLGHAATEAIGLALADGRARVPVTGWTWAPEEAALAALIVGLGALAALVPAVQAYRTDLARTLAQG